MSSEDDKTVFLNKKAAIASGLTEEEAEQVAQRLQANTDAVARFEAIETQLLAANEFIAELRADLQKAKTFGKWLGGFLLANYSTNIIDWLTR